ncbi:MAG: glycosyltransferase [Lachnospiraceae bacterium]|nr:glycosyltransferase [Lachnospiraceae bacterium]
MDKMFSVITVCYNAASDLPVTIESVLAQDYRDYEYIIQDKNSTDDTMRLVGSYREKFAKKGIKFVYRREDDTGLYDAMNKAAASAEGEYVNFMNAGDCFYDKSVLSRAASAAGATILYGDCAVYEYGLFHLFTKSLADIGERMPFSHQSVFAKTSFVREHPFDLGYRYSADYDFLLTAYDLKEKFSDIGAIVCITTADGLSSVNFHDTLSESARILEAHKRPKDSGAAKYVKEIILLVKQFVMDHLPVIKKMIRIAQIRSRGRMIKADVPPWFGLRKSGY